MSVELTGDPSTKQVTWVNTIAVKRDTVIAARNCLECIASWLLLSIISNQLPLSWAVSLLAKSHTHWTSQSLDDNQNLIMVSLPNIVIVGFLQILSEVYYRLACDLL